MGWLKPDVEKMEAEKDVKRLLRTLKYDEDDDVRNRAAEALKNISRGESEEVTEKISDGESDEIKKAGETINPQIMALIAGIILLLIHLKVGFNPIFFVPYFFTSLIFGYSFPIFYKRVGVLLVLPWVFFWWGALLFTPHSPNSAEGNIYFFGILIMSFLLLLVTILGAYLGFFISVLKSEGYSVKKRKNWIQIFILIIIVMFILIGFLFGFM